MEGFAPVIEDSASSVMLQRFSRLIRTRRGEGMLVREIRRRFRHEGFWLARGLRSRRAGAKASAVSWSTCGDNGVHARSEPVRSCRSKEKMAPGVKRIGAGAGLRRVNRHRCGQELQQSSPERGMDQESMGFVATLSQQVSIALASPSPCDNGQSRVCAC